MGELLRKVDDESIPLLSGGIVGRNPTSAIHIQASDVSGAHAEIRWCLSHWEIKDLGSTNGTALDGHVVPAGEWKPLAQGARLEFGSSAHTYIVANTSPPNATAQALDTNEQIQANVGLLLLPDSEEPQVAISQTTSGNWMVEDHEGQRRVVDGETIEVAGRRFRLTLPTMMQTTALGAATLADATLHFQVSSDEEYVRLRIDHAKGSLDLGARAHHYPLYVLATLRLEDADNPTVSEAAQGWVHREDFLKMVTMPSNRLHVSFFRARRQFADAGVNDAVNLIERRAVSKQLRIGAARMVIERL